MKAILLVSIGLLATMLTASAQWQDDFTDGDFSSNPAWLGADTAYSVVNGILELSNNNPLPSPAATVSALYTNSALPNLNNKEWRFFLDHGFSGSDNNQTRVYLTADSPIIGYSGTGSAGVSGYFLLFGEALSNDVIRFYYDDGSAINLIASGTTSIANSFGVSIRVTRDAAANWAIEADVNGGQNYSLEAAISDNSSNGSSYFGFVNKYTSGNADAIQLDNFFVGTIEVDTTPPNVLSVTPTSLTSIDVLFNEAVTVSSATNSANYTIVNIGNAFNATIDAMNPSLVHLTTPAFSANTTYTLGIQNIADLEGNSMSLPSLVEFNYFVPIGANYRDVVFNEILADPSPSAGLPEVEFVELFNRHPTNAFNFQGWKFVNTSTEKILPSFLLAPGEHVVLCDINNASLLEPFGNVIGITSFTALTNTGDSLTLKDNNNQVIDIVVYSDDWFETDSKREGGWSLELVNPELPCANAANWKESIAANGGTPTTINSQFSNAPDTTAPSVVSIVILDAETIQLTFSEPMDTSGWSSPSWDVLPFNSAISGVWSSQLNVVTLALSFPIVPSNYYELVMNGIADCSGNVIAAVNIPFAQGIVPAEGDLIINEIMADPDPSQGLPNAEFIEIRNNTVNLLDLSALHLNSGYFTSQVTLEPFGFLIISDTENNTAFDANAPVAFMESFPGLTNSGLILTLSNEETLLDQLQYSIDWYRDETKTEGGWSLERINPQASCSGRYNWRASNSPTGGTPGFENSVFSLASNGSPGVAEYGVLNDSTLYIAFTESMDTLSFLSLSGDLGNGVIAIDASWNIDREILTLSTSTPLVAELTYTLSLVGLTDCDGNACATSALNFILGLQPMVGDIIINEIMADGSDGEQTASPSVDFIEIFNRTNHLIDLTRLKVNNGFFASQILLQPDSFLIITDSDSDPAQFFAYPNVVYMEGFPLLTEDGTAIHLIVDNDTLETIRYSKSYYNDAEKEAGGWSMERVNPDDPCNSYDNWRACVRSQGSSAGKRNSVLDRSTDGTAPQLLYVLSEPENAVTLVFNEPLMSPGLNVMQWTVDGNAFDATSAYLSGAEQNELVLTYGTMNANTIYSFNLLGIPDCWSNTAMNINGSFALPQTPQEGDLIINELLYDPYESGSDFIEIYNRSAHAVTLDSCAIADATSGEMNSPDFITERNLLLMPGAFLVLARDGRELPSFYANTNRTAVWKVEGMSDFSSDDVAYLLLPNGEVCDQFAYTADLHFPLLNATDGVSLERIDYNRPSDDVTNWHSAAESAGFATPGIVNSQAVQSGAATTTITVEPEIFSPDNDGYNDVVSFSILMEEAGFVGNLHIYNAEGRPVRHLMQNMLLGNEARISWDGIDDDGVKAPIGIYVVMFEAFNSDGQVISGKTSCVLAHPLD
jgi:hypothetical protein